MGRRTDPCPSADDDDSESIPESVPEWVDDEEGYTRFNEQALRERSEYETDTVQSLFSREDLGSLDDDGPRGTLGSGDFSASKSSRVIVLGEDPQGAASVESFSSFDDLGVFDGHLLLASHLFFARTAGATSLSKPSSVMSTLLPAVFGEKKWRGPTYLLAPARSGKTTAVLFAATVFAQRAYDKGSKEFRLQAAPRAIIVVNSAADVAAMLKLVVPGRNVKTKRWTAVFDLDFRFLLGPLRREDVAAIATGCDVLCCDPHNLLELLSATEGHFSDWGKIKVFFDDADECLKRMPKTMGELIQKLGRAGMRLGNVTFLAESWTRDLEYFWSLFTTTSSTGDATDTASDVTSLTQESRLIFVQSEFACAVFMGIATTAFYLTDEEKNNHFRKLIGHLARQTHPVTAIFAKDEETARFLHQQVMAGFEENEATEVDVVLVEKESQIAVAGASSKSRKVFLWSSDMWAKCGHKSPPCDHAVHWDLRKGQGGGEEALVDFECRLGAFGGTWKSIYAKAVASNDFETFRRSGPRMSVYVTVDTEHGAALEKFQAMMDARPDAASKPYMEIVDHRRRKEILAKVAEAIEKADEEKPLCPEFEIYQACHSPRPVCLRHWTKEDLDLEAKFPEGAVVKVQCFRVQGGAVYDGVLLMVDETKLGRSVERPYLPVDHLEFLDELQFDLLENDEDSINRAVDLKKGESYVVHWDSAKTRYNGCTVFRVRLMGVWKDDYATPGPGLVYLVHLLDFGSTEVLRQPLMRKKNAVCFYHLPEKYKKKPGFALTFINTDIVPANNATKWQHMSRSFIEIALGRPLQAVKSTEACFGYFCGKVERVGEGRVYLSNVIAVDAPFKGSLPDLDYVPKDERLGWKLVEDSHAAWRKRGSVIPKPKEVEALSEEGDSADASGSSLAKSDDNSRSLINDNQSLGESPVQSPPPAVAEQPPQAPILSAGRGRGTSLLSRALASEPPVGLTAPPAVQKLPQVTEHSPSGGSDGPAKVSPPSGGDVEVAVNGACTAMVPKRAVDNKSAGAGEAAELAKLLEASQKDDRHLPDLLNFVLERFMTLGDSDPEDFMDEPDSDEDFKDIIPARVKQTEPPNPTDVFTAPTSRDILPSFETSEWEKPVPLKNKVPAARILKNRLPKGDCWKTPNVEWADLRQYIILDIIVPVLHPEAYRLEVTDFHFLLVTSQDKLYKVEFDFGAPVSVKQQHVQARVFPDRVKGKISVQIFKAYPQSWDYLIEPGEKRKHRWLKLNLERVEHEEEELRKKAEDLDALGYDLYRADPDLIFSGLPELTREDKEKLIDMPWDPHPGHTNPGGDLAHSIDLVAEDGDEENDDSLLMRKVRELIDEPGDKDL